MLDPVYIFRNLGHSVAAIVSERHATQKLGSAINLARAFEKAGFRHQICAAPKKANLRARPLHPTVKSATGRALFFLRSKQRSLCWERSISI